MKLNNIELYKLLKEKDIKNFFHANTLTTSLTFIENKGLMSRGLVEKKGLFQTLQTSDELDKKYDVWNDVFIDIVDLHDRFSRQNYYGPILFKFSIEFLKDDIFDVYVTKNNPIYWKESDTEEDKYFKSVDELREDWDKYELQRKMFTIKNTSDPILFDYLEEIIIDDPLVQIEKESIVFSEKLKEELKKVIEKGIISKDYFNWRKCSSCYCKKNYLELPISELKRLFLKEI
ncbi:hypothetical protein CRU98_01610 [Arcobacter sp. CECT 8986]|uniref:hypothetical protein n=1 Tax=Arcobacter sp. CECT 8986 TaxID=2044507 RepID=UPI001009D030|nr:hypothetical protein [Arcobacter sp. CECT 8986]RXK01172.1 hypothetical protein CRU98_01610 [Arcobacter sp. CECT 8986]